MEKIEWKNIIEKSSIFQQKSKKIRYFADISAFTLHALGSAYGGGNVADLSAIFLDDFWPLDFFLVLIQRYRFRPPFLKNPTAIFVIQRLILNLKLDLTV